MHPSKKISLGFINFTALLWFGICLVVTARTSTSLPSGNMDSVPAAEAVATDSLETLREKAMELYEAEDYEKAFPLLRDLYSLNPNDAEVAGRLGFAAKETGAYELALTVLERAIQMRPDDYYCWWWLSDAQRLLGNYTEALRSMEQARDIAPPEVRNELQEYVTYTSVLLDKTPSWENFDQHLRFAERHRAHRRTRRQIEEYVNALDVAPVIVGEDKEGTVRMAWVLQQIGIQYLYIEEPDAAIDYLKRANEYARRMDVLREVMQQEQFIAIAYRTKADKRPHEATPFLEKSAAHWRSALELAVRLEDISYIRYARGRLLETLCMFVPVNSDEISALRKQNLKEVPWQGPVNEFSVAEAVIGEVRCRIEEGDLAGARVLIEMALPYFESSNYLSDYQRLRDLYLDLAWIYFQQGHFTESLNTVSKASDKAEQYKIYVDADAFNRSAGERALRGIATAKARAYIAQGLPEKAFETLENYSTQHLLNLLGTKIKDDALRTDAASEKSVIRRRIAMLDALLAKARDAEEEEEVARLEQRLAADRARLEWLDKGITFIAPEKLAFKPITVQEVNALQHVLNEETAYVAYLFDKWGGVAIWVNATGIKAALLEPTEVDVYQLSHSDITTLPEQKCMEASQTWYKKLISPLEPTPETKVLAVAQDETLFGFPMGLLHDTEAYLEDRFRLVYTHSASRLVALMETTPMSVDQIRYVCGRENMNTHFCNRDNPPDENGPSFRCLQGDSLVVPMMISDIQQNEVLHVGATLDQRPEDPLLCSFVLGSGGQEKELPTAQLLGMKIPSPLVVLDIEVAKGEFLRPDTIKSIVEVLHHAGIKRLLVIHPSRDDTLRQEFFEAFYNALGQGEIKEAFKAAKEAMRKRNTVVPVDCFFWLYGSIY